MKHKLIKLALVILIAVVIFFVFIFKEEKDLTTSVYSDNTFPLSFIPLSFLGDITLDYNYYTCPEDDTYRTADALPIYDKEIKWADYTLPSSQSFISSGIRFKYLDTDDGKICGSDLFERLASKEIIGEILSSVQLNTIQVGDFYGVYNKNASRLNTAYTRQYTFFGKDKDGRQFVAQAYISFIPYAESKELKEMEEVYSGNMNEYIDNGQTSSIIRERLGSFEEMLMGMKKDIL